MGGPKLILLILLILTYPNLSHLSQWSKFPDESTLRLLPLKHHPGEWSELAELAMDRGLG